MKQFRVQQKDINGKVWYVQNKTYTIKGKKYEKLTDEGIRAKFYNSEKVAQKKADALNESGLYEGNAFMVDSVCIKVCNVD